MASEQDALQPPRASALASNNRDSFVSSADTSAAPSFKAAHDSSSYMGPAVPELHNTEGDHSKGRRRTLLCALGGLAALAIIVVAVVVPVYFKVIKHSSSSAASANSGGTTPGAAPGGGSPPTHNVPTSGGDGSTVTKDDGSTFTYTNKLGGFWVFDPTNPYNNSAQAQSYTPPLNQPWKYGVDRIYGVNLGGWLVLEPFISPKLYEPYINSNPNFHGTQAVDEWTLCTNIAANQSSGGVAKVLEDHYATFITEEDFAQIASAGLNWVRIPLPYWAIEKYDDEPFLEGVSWKYFLKAIEWARKYGLRINLDLHSLPGSQNGYNHSGRYGVVNFLEGVMGIANAQRSLNIIRTITEFISQDQYKDVVCMMGAVNEPQVPIITQPVMTSWYIEVHDMMRNITGLGKGPWMSLHNPPFAFDFWEGLMPGADRVTLEGHPYFCFGNQFADPADAKPCTAWGPGYTAARATNGWVQAGEWSLAINDCAYMMNGVGLGSRYDGTFNGPAGAGGGPRIGSCDPWLDADRFTPAVKAGLKLLAQQSMDATRDSFFWTWKIGPSDRTGKVNSPLWSYKLGLDGGWISPDPRESIGVCQNVGARNPLQPTQTSYAGQTIAPAYRAQFPWPPEGIVGHPNAAVLPQYTPTGTPVTLAAQTFPSATVQPESGWMGPNGGWTGDYVPKQGCDYPDQWDSNRDGVAVPAQCNPQRRIVRGAPRETGLAR